MILGEICASLKNQRSDCIFLDAWEKRQKIKKGKFANYFMATDDQANCYRKRI